MAERDPERRARAQLWVGPGRRARETAVLLAALATLDGEGEPRADPPPTATVADLAELLTQRGREGLLILEATRVPAEDIGFVRRFLERHPERRLVLVGSDEAEARALLALGRTTWLAWPPHVEALRALLHAPPPGPTRALERPAGGPASAPNGACDLRAVLEELLASALLQGDGGARFQLRPGAACPVRAERAPVAAALGELVALARACAGADGLVRAALDPGADGARVELDFPRGGLSDADLALDGPGGELPAPVAEGRRGARRAAERLRAAGARVVLAGAGPERVRCEVRFGAREASASRAPALGKPEDPFA